MSPFMFKVGTREKLISSRAAARLAAEISGEFGTVSGLILQLSRDGLAFAINQEAAYGLFSAQEMPGELVTVRYTTTDRYSQPTPNGGDRGRRLV